MECSAFPVFTDRNERTVGPVWTKGLIFCCRVQSPQGRERQIAHVPLTSDLRRTTPVQGHQGYPIRRERAAGLKRSSVQIFYQKRAGYGRSYLIFDIESVLEKVGYQITTILSRRKTN